MDQIELQLGSTILFGLGLPLGLLVVLVYSLTSRPKWWRTHWRGP